MLLERFPTYEVLHLHTETHRRKQIDCCLERASRIAPFVKDFEILFLGVLSLLETNQRSCFLTVLAEVQKNFTDPATNATARVDALSDDLSTKHAKLRDMRAKLNNATQDVNEANTANAVNSKNLAEQRDAINSEWHGMPGT